MNLFLEIFLSSVYDSKSSKHMMCFILRAYIISSDEPDSNAQELHMARDNNTGQRRITQ